MTRQIAIVTNLYPSPDRQHFGTFVKNAHDTLVSQGWDVTLISLPRKSNAIAAYASFYWRAFTALVRFKGIAYVHYVSHSALPAIAAKLLNPGLKVIPHYHGSDAFPEAHEGGVRSVAKGALCFAANLIAQGVVVPSADFGERVRTKFAYRRDMFVSPSGGVDTNVFCGPDPQTGREFSVGFAGRLIPGKGALMAARVISRFLERNKDARAIMIGDGEQKQAVDDVLSEARCENRVVTTGLLPQRALADHFRNTHVLLFPSSRKGESLGLVWIEAALCGAIPLVLENGVTEKLVPAQWRHVLVCKDESELSERLALLFEDPALMREVRNALSSELVGTYGASGVGERLHDYLSHA